jgi:hypothetical protein
MIYNNPHPLHTPKAVIYDLEYAIKNSTENPLYLKWAQLLTKTDASTPRVLTEAELDILNEYNNWFVLTIISKAASFYIDDLNDNSRVSNTYTEFEQDYLQTAISSVFETNNDKLTAVASLNNKDIAVIKETFTKKATSLAKKILEPLFTNLLQIKATLENVGELLIDNENRVSTVLVRSTDAISQYQTKVIGKHTQRLSSDRQAWKSFIQEAQTILPPHYTSDTDNRVNILLANTPLRLQEEQSHCCAITAIEAYMALYKNPQVPCTEAQRVNILNTLNWIFSQKIDLTKHTLNDRRTVQGLAKLHLLASIKIDPTIRADLTLLKYAYPNKASAPLVKSSPSASTSQALILRDQNRQVALRDKNTPQGKYNAELLRVMMDLEDRVGANAFLKWWRSLFVDTNIPIIEEHALAAATLALSVHNQTADSELVESIVRKTADLVKNRYATQDGADVAIDLVYSAFPGKPDDLKLVLKTAPQGNIQGDDDDELVISTPRSSAEYSKVDEHTSLLDTKASTSNRKASIQRKSSTASLGASASGAPRPTSSSSEATYGATSSSANKQSASRKGSTDDRPPPAEKKSQSDSCILL